MRRLIAGALLCAALGCYVVRCDAQTLKSSDLVNEAKQYDGNPIVYKGEVVGDIMIRQDHAWLHVNDGIIAIGVWAPKALVRDIRFAGDYHKKGDIVKVSGTFHRSCLEHGGDLDIHALAIIKEVSGSYVVHPVSRKKMRAGIYSLAFVLLFYALKKIFQRNQRT